MLQQELGWSQRLDFTYSVGVRVEVASFHWSRRIPFAAFGFLAAVLLTVSKGR